jgi:crossover junction endodeoxyribonuclease RuvC
MSKVPVKKLVVGMDPSLTSSGLCLRSDGKVLAVRSIKTEPKNFPCDLARYRHIADEVMGFIPDNVSLVVVEDFFTPSNSAQIGSAMKLIGLGHLVRMRMYDQRIPFVVPAPSQLKKFVSGNGNCPKDMICKEVYKRWGIDTKNDDEADAVVGAHLAVALVEQLRGEDMSSYAKFQMDVVTNVLADRPFYNREYFQ